MKVNIKFKQLVNDVQLPKKATKGAACYDVYSPANYPPLVPGEFRVIPLGFSVKVPDGFELQIRARSGLSKRGIIVANGVGCIDSDYRGEVGVILGNQSSAIQPINKGDRICQIKVAFAPEIEWEEIDVLDCTERGEGGYGSTGV